MNCPRCNTTLILVGRQVYDLPAIMDPCAFCPTCNLSGPVESTESEALEAYARKYARNINPEEE